MIRRSLVLVGLILAGCSSAPEGETASTESASVAHTHEGRQLVRWVSQDVLEAKTEAFRARNGADWQGELGNLERRVFPIVTHVKRAPGHIQLPGYPAAENKAIAFAKKNADLLGLKDTNFETFRSPSLRSLALRTIPQLPAAHAHLDIELPYVIVDFKFDAAGEIAEVERRSELPLPVEALTIDTHPRLAATDPSIRARVLGRPLTLVDDGPGGGPSPFWPNQEPRDVGKVEVADLDAAIITSTLHEKETDEGLLLTVAHAIVVSRENECVLGAHFRFVVDASSTELLEFPDPGHCPWMW